MEGEPSLPRISGLRSSHPRRQRNEIRWCCQLDVDVRVLLESRISRRISSRSGIELDVDVDGRLSPAVENRCRSAGEIDAALNRDGSSQLIA